MNLQISDQHTVETELKLVQELANCQKTDIEINNVGWTSRVYIVSKGKYVFKFPRTKKVTKEYEQEVKILKLLENTENSIQIPRILWVGTNYNYLGYEGVIGQTFDQVIDKLKTAEKKDIGQQIGKFLIQLHSLELDGVPRITIQDEILQFQSHYQTALPTISKHFTSDEQIQLKKMIFESMPAIVLKLGSDSVLCHGDLGYYNLILSNQNKVGAFDFGDVGYYDKSKDFLGLDEKELLNSTLSVYGDVNILRQKIAVRQKVLPLLELTYFIENNIKQMTDMTLEKLRVAL